MASQPMMRRVDEGATSASFNLGAEGMKKDEWVLFYSDAAKYERQDFFDKEFTRSTFREVFQLYEKWELRFWFSWIPVVIAVVAVFLGVTNAGDKFGQYHDVLRLFFGSDGWPVTAFATVSFAFLNELNARVEFLRRIERFRESFREKIFQNEQFRQIFIGIGSLTFSYGDRGFAVDGGNLQFRADWHAFNAVELWRVPTPPAEGKTDAKQLAPRLLPPGSPPEQATHIVIHVKQDADHDVEAWPPTEDMPTPLERLAAKKASANRPKTPPAKEFLVVPRARFFDSDRNVTDWTTFVEGVEARVHA